MAKRVKKVKESWDDEMLRKRLTKPLDKWLEAAKLHQSLKFEQCHPKLELSGKE